MIVSARSVGSLLVVVASLTSCLAEPAPLPQDPALRVEWLAHGGDPGALKYSPADQLTPQNVSALRPAWTWEVGETARRHDEPGDPVVGGPFQATPLMAGDTLFLTTPFASAVALDARSGRELWRFESEAWRWPNPGGRPGFVHRGVALWTGDGERRILLQSRWRLFALDAATGELIPGFGDGGSIDLSQDLRWPVNRLHVSATAPPVLYRDIVITGSSISDQVVHPNDPLGEVQAFDVRTGRRLWTWDPLPREGQPGADTWDSLGRAMTGHLNVWTFMTVDTGRGLVYLPVSTPSNDWYGGARHGDNLFAESLVCLDATTGEMRWHFQTVRHGLWDYDPAAPPVLATIPWEGGPRDIVALAGKTGFLYILDRVTGDPLWPIEDRPVPPSDVPGEQAAATQPFPTWPRPFAQQGFSTEDLVDFTPEIREMALDKVRGARMGPIFTPPSLQGTVVMPGWIGGAGWGGGAVDPERGMIYVKATNRPAFGRLVVPRATDTLVAARYVLDFSVNPNSALNLRLPGPRRWWPPFRRREVAVPINKPPYGTLTAIDLASGEHRWQVPLGDTPALRSLPMLRELDLPPLGVSGAPGGVVTASGLIFITGGGETLYAMDVMDGSVVWSWDLGAPATANPMTYVTAEGRQMVAIAVGEGTEARLRTFVLPR